MIKSKTDLREAESELSFYGCLFPLKLVNSWNLSTAGGNVDVTHQQLRGKKSRNLRNCLWHMEASQWRCSKVILCVSVSVCLYMYGMRLIVFVMCDTMSDIGTDKKKRQTTLASVCETERKRDNAWKTPAAFMTSKHILWPLRGAISIPCVLSQIGSCWMHRRCWLWQLLHMQMLWLVAPSNFMFSWPALLLKHMTWNPSLQSLASPASWINHSPGRPCSEPTERKMRKGCVYISDAWCSNAVRVDGTLFPKYPVYFYTKIRRKILLHLGQILTPSHLLADTMASNLEVTCFSP